MEKMNRNGQVNKDLVIEFLNMALADVDIVDVDFIPKGHLRYTDGNRKVVFDFSCRCRDGSTVIIKMQFTDSLLNESRRGYLRGHSSEWDISRLEWENTV